ncbi:PREDICTED: A-kinase anchor protein 17B [Gavialis gangeticus]|uniref:A-kinase anchor protein 17B n=1 Tax=Gavialis gangeticus TaxID=94835 RepID=UPI00092EAFF2|nr:PREDICTED: A-kinase anchor protein 17B [Gavialis gangeticus]
MPEWEERKYLLAQRRVESVRLLTVLLNRVKDFAQLTSQKVEPLLDLGDLRKNHFPETELQTAQKEQKDFHYLGEQKHGEKFKYRLFQTDGSSFSEREWETKLPASSCHIVRTVLNDPAVTLSSGKLTRVDKYSSSESGSLQITITQDCKLVESLDRENSPALNVANSQTACDTGCRKKQKVYETDEFIHYLLNYYQTPRYARVCLQPKTAVSKSWWQRVVSDNGNSFQINLRNKYGQHLAEKSFVQNLDERTCSRDDNYRWEITIEKSEPTSGTSKHKTCFQGFTNNFQIQWNDSLNTGNFPRVELNNSFGGTNLGHNKESKQDSNSRKVTLPYKPSGSAYKLNELLEEISSDSEYFSSLVKRTERKYEKVFSDGNKLCSLVGKEEKKILVCVKNAAQNDEDSESKKCSFCSNSVPDGLTKQSGRKLKKSCKRSSSKLRHEGQRSERRSREEERHAHKKKKKRKKPLTNILSDEYGFSETDGCRQLATLKKTQRKCNKIVHHKMKLKTLHTVTAVSKDAVSPDASALQGSHQKAGEERKLILRKEMDSNSAVRGFPPFPVEMIETNPCADTVCEAEPSRGC